MTANITEKALTADIRKLLKQHGGHFIKHWGGPMAKAGVADLIGCYRGLAIAIEVKSTKGKLSQAQELFLSRWRQAGGIGIVARSVTDVIEALGLKTLF